MRQFLSHVEEVFQISNRGCVVVPGYLRESSLTTAVGDTVWIQRPDGTELKTTIAGLEMTHPSDPRCIPLLLTNNILKTDIPVGSELWISASEADERG